MHFWAHLRTVHRHRALVRKYCFRLGLYWQGLTHDLSKYSPVEFFAGVKYFQGDHSPNDAQRKEHGYSASWLHHKGATATTSNTGRTTPPTAAASPG